MPRTDLVARLNAAVCGALTLLSAPAGFGKTSLLAQWVADCHLPVAWLSLDEDDSTPARFLRYLAAALESAGALTPAGLAQWSEAQILPPKAALTYLLSDLEQAGPPVVAVLDDYHLVSSQAVHELMSYLLDHLPARLHLIIATRADPPIPLARLRAQGALVELRVEDLRFTPAETSAYLAGQGLALPPEQVHKLETRTEGWPAGLQLAALALQRMHDPAAAVAFVDSFSGSHRFILDYLLQEVLSHQATEVQAFLLHTSLLERFNAALCAAVTDIPLTQVQAMLDELERANLFFVPLDPARHWWRYHHLFADLLRARLLIDQPARIPALHLRAAHWLEQNGLVTQAVQHALSAGDVDLAAGWLERHGAQRWASSDTSFMLLAGRLPIETLRARPMLGIFVAWISIISGRVQAVEPLLRELAAELATAPANPAVSAMRGFVDMLLIYTADLTGQNAPRDLPDPRILDLVSPSSLAMRNSADVMLALLYAARGQFATVETILQATLQRDMAAEGSTAAPIVATMLARSRSVQGRLREAEALLQRHIAWVEARGAWRFYLAGNLHLALGAVLREWDRLDEAEAQIRKGMALNEAWNIPSAIASGATALARLHRARGELAEAAATLQQAENLIAGRLMPPDYLIEFRLEQVHLWLAQGRLAEAQAWADSLVPPHPTSASTAIRRELEGLMLARVHLQAGRPQDCRAVLAPLEPPMRGGERRGRLITLLLLDALALHVLDQTPRALQRLLEAFALAASQGYRRTFLDEGTPMQALLRVYLRQANPSHQAHAESLLLQSVAASRPALDLVEPLSPRELEVLELLCAGRSNKDIAAALFITVSAVKKHTGNIYGKLGVSTRAQAIALTNQAGLFPRS